MNLLSLASPVPGAMGSWFDALFMSGLVFALPLGFAGLALQSLTEELLFRAFLLTGLAAVLAVLIRRSARRLLSGYAEPQ